MFKYNSESINEWLEENNVLLVNQGFTNAYDNLKEFGTDYSMTNFLNKARTQHTAKEANDSKPANR